MNERIRKIGKTVGKHLNDNMDLYFMYAVGAGAGILSYKYFGKGRFEVVNSVGVVNAFIAGIQSTGSQLYVLTNEQAALWEATLAAAQAASEVAG